jgi:hypothetical protein
MLFKLLSIITVALVSVSGLFFVGAVTTHAHNIKLTEDNLEPLTGFFTHPAPGSTISREIQYGHDGLDLAGSYNDQILAAADGEVLYTQDTLHKSGGYGFYILLKHQSPLGDVYTLYAHLSTPTHLRTGESVRQGQHIGNMGSTGVSTGVHLHFAIFNSLYLPNGTFQFHPTCQSQYGKYAGTCIAPLHKDIRITSFIHGHADEQNETSNPAYTSSSIINLQTINANQSITFRDIDVVVNELFQNPECKDNTSACREIEIENSRNTVNRSDLAKIVIQSVRNTSTGQSNLPNSIRFETIEDVDSSHDNHSYIQRAVFSDLIPLEQGKYNPDQEISREDAAEILIKASAISH